MGPLDFLKQKLMQGLGAIGGDVAHLFGGGPQSAPTPPAAAPQTLKVAPIQTPQSPQNVRVAQPNQPAPLQVQNQTPAMQPPASPATPVISGVRTVADTNNAINNPSMHLAPAQIAAGQNLRVAPPATMTPGTIPSAPTNPAPAPVAKTPSDHFSDFSQQVTNLLQHNALSKVPIVGSLLNTIGTGSQELTNAAIEHGGNLPGTQANPVAGAAAGAGAMLHTGAQMALGGPEYLFGSAMAQGFSPNKPIDNPASEYLTGGPAESFTQQVKSMGLPATALNTGMALLGTADALGDVGHTVRGIAGNVAPTIADEHGFITPPTGEPVGEVPVEPHEAPPEPAQGPLSPEMTNNAPAEGAPNPEAAPSEEDWAHIMETNPELDARLRSPGETDIAPEELLGPSRSSAPEPGAGPLTDEQRQAIIEGNPEQQTVNHVEINVPEGNVKGAIAQATGVTDEMKTRFDRSLALGSKLDRNDQQLLYNYDDGEDPAALARAAHNPKAFVTALTAIEDAHDYELAADRAAGGLTLRQHAYLPHFYAATSAQMDALGIPQDERFSQGKYHGFHDTSAKYRSYIEASQHGLTPLFESPLDAIQAYSKGAVQHVRGQALYTALKQAAPKDVGELSDVSDDEGRRFTQAAGNLPFSASQHLQPALKRFGQGVQITNPIAKAVLSGLHAANVTAKQTLLSLAPFHYVNITKNFLGLTLGSGHPIIAGKGIAQALASSFNPKFAEKLNDVYTRNGTADWKAAAGVRDANTYAVTRNETGDLAGAIKVANSKANPLEMMHRNMNSFINQLGNVLADAARSHGIDPRSPEGTALGEEYNKVLGRINEQVMGSDPTMTKIFSEGALAPHYTRSQLALVKDMFARGGKTGVGLFQAGDVARTAVFGARITEAAVGIIATAVATGQMPTFASMMQSAGLLPNNPIPNINAGQKNAKGESQLVNLPTDPLGLIAGAVSDPKHFAISRYSPALSLATQAITNTSWNGQPLVDKSKPDWQMQMAKKLVQNLAPIGVQNFTTPNVDLAQSIEQEFGGRVKTNPNDPQAAATMAYFNEQKVQQNNLLTGQFGKINPALSGLDPKYGPYFAAQYVALHPTNATDINGIKIPQPWDALSNERLPSYYLMNDQKTGQQALSPLYYVDKAAAMADPSRPHNGLFDLSDDQAKVALAYQNTPSGDPQRIMMEQANPWLVSYETSQSVAAQNYQPVMTKFLQSEGWTPAAIAQYWTQHPSNTGPLAPPSFPQATQDLMTQYQGITDPTQRAQFFSQHADVLSNAFDAESQYVNQKRIDSGDLPEYGFPTETDHVKQVLASMPQGADPASKAARAQLINGNPDVNQYLADVALHDATKDLAENYYQTNPRMTEGQVLNNGSPLSQSTLKNISSLGAYDIGKNPDGTYNFTQNGAVQGKTGSGGSGGSSSSKKRPMVARPPRLRPNMVHVKPPPKARKIYLTKAHLKQSGPVHVAGVGKSGIKIRRVA